jgi:hypothetical protein
MYCGFCWGVDSEGGMLYGTDVVKCSPGDCCNYGYLDGRCNVNDQMDVKKVREQYCPGGMLLKSKWKAEIGIAGKKKETAKRQHIINDEFEGNVDTATAPQTDHKPQSCNSNCSCPKSAFPSEGQLYCGWCSLVGSTSGTPLLVEDKIVCRNDGCCNYGNEDITCRGDGDFWPDPMYCQPPQGA